VLARKRVVSDAHPVTSRVTKYRHAGIKPYVPVAALMAVAALHTGRFAAALEDTAEPVEGAVTTAKPARAVHRARSTDRSKKLKLLDAGTTDAGPAASVFPVDAGPSLHLDETRRPIPDASTPQHDVRTSTATTVDSATAPSAASSPVAQPHAGIDVRVREMVVLTLHLSDGGMSAAERAKRANRAIEQAIGGSSPKTVRVEQAGSRSIVFIGAQPVVELTADDAAVAGEGSLDLYAASVKARIADMLSAEEKRSQLGKTVLNVVIVVLLGLVALYSLKLSRGWSLRARGWVERNPQRIPAIRFKSIEVVRPPVLRNAALVSLAVFKWIAQIGAIYLWLIVSMSLFEPTRGYTEKLTGLVLSPLSTLTGRIAALLPLTVLVAFGAVVLMILLRFISLFFAAVERGETEVEHLTPALAAPTSFVVQIGLVVLSLLVVAPVLTGNFDGTFSRLGQLAVAAIAVALVPLITTVFLGMRVLYSSRLAVGQWVSIGAISGRILELTLFDTRIWMPGGATARVPHLVLLWQTLRTSTGVVNSVCISVATLSQLADVVEELTAVAARFGTDATVTVDSVAPDRADLTVQVTMLESTSKNDLLFDVLRALADRKIPLAEPSNSTPRR
jgi:hypothetical protein